MVSNEQKKLILKGMFNSTFNLPEDSEPRHRFFDHIEARERSAAELDVLRDLIELARKYAGRVHDEWVKAADRAGVKFNASMTNAVESTNASKIGEDPVSGDG